MITIDGITYSEEYIKKAIILYSDFESGALEQTIKEELQK